MHTSLRERSSTPSALALPLATSRQAGHTEQIERLTLWLSKDASPTRYLDTLVLRTLAVLRLAGLPLTTDPDRLTRCSLSSNLLPLEIARVLEFLQKDGWLTRSPALGEVGAHDVRISPSAVRLLTPNGRPSEALLSYARALIQADPFPERPAIAEALGRLLMSGREWCLAKAALQSTRAEGQAAPSLLARIAICETFSEKEDESANGIASLRALAAGDPDDPRPAVELAHALARKKKRQEGVSAVRELILQSGLLSPKARLAALEALMSLMEELVRHDLALRENADDGRYLTGSWIGC